MTRREEIERELRAGEKAEQDGNSGRTRVCARRAVGLALEEYYSRRGENGGKDAVKLLARFSEERNIPKEIQEASLHLQARVRPDFTSASQDPLHDARLIIDFVNPTH